MSKSQISLFLTQKKDSKEKPFKLFINGGEFEQKDFAKHLQQGHS